MNILNLEQFESVNKFRNYRRKKKQSKFLTLFADKKKSATV